jgi:tRNA pseudouridine38-40 synthase
MFTRLSTQRVALLIEYQGTSYAGFQIQPGQHTIQGCLETALQQLYGQRIQAVGAGRTDAGVHAVGQVVAITAPKTLPFRDLVMGLNSYLPKDIAVRDTCEVSLDFNPRRDALRRTYRYTALLRQSRSALLRDWAYQLVGRLDIPLMNWAASLIYGERDWSAFSATLSSQRSAVRWIEATTMMRCGEHLSFTMTANAFLPQQVRRTVGALIRLGQGKLEADDFKALVEEGGPGAASWPVPARGLCLIRIDYGDKLSFRGGFDENVSG